MENQSFNDLARNAWVIYKMATDMQKTMLQMFFEEFCDLEEEEQSLRMQQQDLPF